MNFDKNSNFQRSRNICTDNLPFPCSSTKEVIDVAQQPKNAVVKNTTDTGKVCFTISAAQTIAKQVQENWAENINE